MDGRALLLLALAASTFGRTTKPHPSHPPPALPAPPAEPPSTEILQFLFDKRLALFNTRRDHEWRVTFGAMLLIGGIDAGLLANKLHLTLTGSVVWCVALGLLFTVVSAYQFGVQTRNRVDRLAMDAIYSRLCDIEQLPNDSVARVGVDRADSLLRPLGAGIVQFTFLWAFACQSLVLLAGCLLSAALPFVLNGWFVVAAQTAP